MTAPRDDIDGLIERLRISLAGVAREETGGDNLAILLASYFEPSIEDEELDDSGTWKQGAIDACNKVLDAIHGHYATTLDALRARVKELEAECFRLAADTCHAGYGDEYGNHRCREVDAAEARALRLQQERDEALSKANIIQNMDETALIGLVMTLTGGSANPEVVRGQIDRVRRHHGKSGSGDRRRHPPTRGRQ